MPLMPTSQVSFNLVDREVEIIVTDPAGSALTVADGQAYFIISSNLGGKKLVDAQAAVVTVSSSGTPTIQIRNVTQSLDILSTKITIDANENTSYSSLIPTVINTANATVNTGDIIAIDIDVAGTGAKGLIVILTFRA